MVPLIPTFAYKAFMCTLLPDSPARMVHSTLLSPMLNEHEKPIKGPDTLESGQFNKPTFPFPQGDNVRNIHSPNVKSATKGLTLMYHVFFKIVIVVISVKIMTDKRQTSYHWTKRSRGRGKGEQTRFSTSPLLALMI